jgi:predicted AlkP superfamily pyrophosphatase or phosphodiesterase
MSVCGPNSAEGTGMRRFALAVGALLATAAGATPPLQPPPKLLIVISIDQFSADLWDEYRPQFTGGFARLASGTVFRNGYQSHAATETCPGHSTLLTGDRPATTGIVANIWTDQSVTRSDKSVYCAEDELASGSSSTAYKVSDKHLRVPTLGDRMKAVSPTSRNVAVSGKDRAAVMMSGHHPDQRWYWDGKQFATDLTGVAPPRVVGAANDAVRNLLSAPSQPLQPPPFCTAKAQPITLEGSGKIVGNGTLARAAGDANAFRASPEIDAATLALAAGLVQEMKLGGGSVSDLLAISLSATDYVGHTYGPGGQEMCLQLLELDRELGDFFAFLDRSGLDYGLVLSADHGGLDIPERLRLHGVADAARVDPALAASAMGKRIGQKLGLAGPVLIGEFSGDVFIDKDLKPTDRGRVLREALTEYRAHPQVAAALSRDQIAKTPMPTASPVGWSLVQKARASFDPERSGDIVVMLKPHITPIVDTSRYASTHGSPWDYDRRVPIAFWRKGFPAASREDAVETVDIMPTLAAMLGLPITAPAVDGKCLDGVPGVVCSRR